MLRFDGFIFTLLNLVVLYVAMRHFLIGPIQNVLAARKEMIDKQFATAQSKEDEAMQLKQRYDGLLENAKEESRTRAGKEYEERVQKAERQANRILEKAKQDVENEREQAMEAMQKQIAGVAMAAAGKILKEQADSSVDRSIYDQYIAGIGESHEADGN